MRGHKFTIDDVRKTAKAMGYEVLNSEYIDSKHSMDFVCKKHGVFHKRYSHLLEGSGCPECNGASKRIKANTSIAMNLANKAGYLFPDNADIKKATQKFTLVCEKHGEFKSSIDFLRRGVGCPKCGTERMASKERTPYEVVKKAFELRDKTLLSSTYKEKHIPLPYICNKHPDRGIQYMSYSHLLGGEGCFQCGIDKRSGSNNANWKGGTSDLSAFLRGSLFSWKMGLFKQAGWRCSITGKQGTLNVHHLGTTFKCIVEKTFSDLGLDIRSNVCDYSEDEQKLIRDKLVENNERMATPVVMLGDVHRRFHSFCGGNSKPTSRKQLERFKEIIKTKQLVEAG